MVPIDFNESSLEDLAKEPGFDSQARTLFVMEGLTQYLPKEATKRSLEIAAKISGPRSRLALSYIDQHVFDDPVNIALYLDPGGLRAWIENPDFGGSVLCCTK